MTVAARQVEPILSVSGDDVTVWPVGAPAPVTLTRREAAALLYDRGEVLTDAKRLATLAKNLLDAVAEHGHDRRPGKISEAAGELREELKGHAI